MTQRILRSGNGQIGERAARLFVDNAIAACSPPPIESMLAVTSLSPSPQRKNRQQWCIASWQSIGLRVVAVQQASEIERLRPHFAGVEFVESERSHSSKPHVLVKDLAAVAVDRDVPIFLINSDIEIAGQRGEFLRLWSPESDRLKIGIRYNHSAGGSPELEPHGLDAFLLTPEMAEGLPDLDFAIGLPFWDYWLPHDLRARGYRICMRSEPLLFHERHPQQWTHRDWLAGLREFQRHYHASDFSAIHFRTSLRETRKLPARVNGRRLDLDLPEAGRSHNSAAIFSLPKSGSTFVNAMIADLCQATMDFSAVDLPGWLFRNGVAYHVANIDGIEGILQTPGYCFGGFRSFPDWLDENAMLNMRRVLVVRDPRDIMISLYFSVRDSHAIPPAGELSEELRRHREAVRSMSLEQYVTGDAADWMLANFDRMAARVCGADCLVVRYEDMVYRKRDFATRLNAHLGMRVAKEHIGQAADRQDIFPEHENPKRHIRRVTPGDFRQKLSQRAIASLTAKFAEPIERFGYAT